MCVYCAIGDWHARRDPPWPDFWRESPHIPQPLFPKPGQMPWPLDKLKEFTDLLERVKKIEDALGCPCEPNKADYLGILKGRIEKIEKHMREQSP